MNGIVKTFEELIEALRKPRLRPLPVSVRVKDARSITEEDKRLIMEHANELFGIGGEQRGKRPAGAGPITEEDKRIIMKHIDQLFAIGEGQN